MQTGRFSQALKSEISAVRQDRWMFAFVFWVPPLLSLFMLLIFYAGMPTDLPIGVVDLDHSSLSRKATRYFDASPVMNVTRHYSSVAEGKADIGTASIYALVIIPSDFSRDVARGRAPAITAFFNAQYLLIAEAMRGALIEIETTLAVEADVARTLVFKPVMQAAIATALPVRSQMTPLYNLNMNYAVFLVPALLMACFQLLVVCITILSLAKMVKTCEASGDKYQVGQFMGRFFFYTCVFSVHILFSVFILYGVLDWPLQASLAGLLPLVFVFVMACQVLGGVIHVATFNLELSLSAASAYCGPAFAFFGVTFPATDMSLIAQIVRLSMPGAHFLEAFYNHVSYDAGLYYSLIPGLIVLAYFLLAPIVAYRLKSRLAGAG